MTSSLVYCQSSALYRGDRALPDPAPDDQFARPLEPVGSFELPQFLFDLGRYSDVIFGLFFLLGYQFSPRLADAGEARF
jgi:hypothetical protein